MLNKGINHAEGNETPIYTFSDEQTKRKIRRHLKDINDVITEKDIKNAKVPGAEEKPAAKPGKRSAIPVTNGKKTKKSKTVVDDAPGNPVTPWDIIVE